jgi:hypothetical protein
MSKITSRDPILTLRNIAYAVAALLFVLSVLVVQPSATQASAYDYPTTSAYHTTVTTTSTYTVKNPGPMTFAALDESLSYGIPSYATSEVQQADLSMLYSTGAHCVRVDLNYAPWLLGYGDVISLVNSTIQSIKSSGHCLIIADAGSETYWGNGCLDWAQFKTAWVERVSTLAAFYKPQYYIVIKEPGWYVPMVCDSLTNPLFQNSTDWIDLTQNLTEAVHAASPNTAVGVSVAADNVNNEYSFYAPYLNGVQGIPGFSFIGFDIYDTLGQNATSGYLAYNHPTKSVWIAETWNSWGSGVYNSKYASADSTWMKSIYTFGHSIGASMLMPFYTNLFSGFTIPTTTKGLTSFYQNRTTVYTAFKNVVSDHS